MQTSNKLVNNSINTYFGEVEISNSLQGVLYDIVKLSTTYKAAMKEVLTKLEILDSEFNSLYNHNPIHHTEHRLKSQLSILKKMERKGIATTEEMIGTITDIAGIRVVCPYMEDVYNLAEMLLSQSDITLVEVRDYIKSPKENGYRSLHLIIKVPVYLSASTEYVFVEIQLRTIAMDMWASLEHEIRYKSEKNISKNNISELKICSEMLHSVDNTMQNIYKQTGKNYNE